MFTFRRKILILTLVTLVALAATWSGIALGGQTSSTIQVGKKEGLGNYLMDSKGMALYYFKKDSPGKSACTGDCLVKWPIFYTETIIVSPELNAKDFGQITRDDGKKQTTYKGMPLYYFFKDGGPGDAYGQGVNNVWYVIDPATFKPDR